MNGRRILILLSALAVLFIISYFREFLFVGINDLLFYKFNNLELPLNLVHKLPFNLEEKSYLFLYVLKWVLTLAFSLFYLILSVLFLRRIFKTEVKLILVTFYALVFLIALILMGTGYILPGIMAYCYKYSRFLTGILQSPFPFMIMAAYFSFYKKELNTI